MSAQRLYLSLLRIHPLLSLSGGGERERRWKRRGCGEEEDVERKRMWRGRGCGEEEGVERKRMWRGRGCGEEEDVERKRMWRGRGRGSTLFGGEFEKLLVQLEVEVGGVCETLLCHCVLTQTFQHLPPWWRCCCCCCCCVVVVLLLLLMLLMCCCGIEALLYCRCVISVVDVVVQLLELLDVSVLSSLSLLQPEYQ